MSPLDRVYEVVDSVVQGSVSMPDAALYYVNYRLYTNTWVSNTWVDTEEEIHLGPYPFELARFVVENVVPKEERYGRGINTYTSKPTMSLKPRKKSKKRTGPTKEEVEKIILEKVSEQLDTYRRVQEWCSLAYRPSVSTSPSSEL